MPPEVTPTETPTPNSEVVTPVVAVVTDPAAKGPAGTDEAKLAAEKVAKDAADKAAAQTAEQKAAAEAAAKAAGAPEKYEAFTAPEGTALDKEIVTTFESVAKDLNLSQASAQKLIDKISPAMKARADQASEQVKADLLAASKADPEIGGEHFDENVASAKLAIAAWFTPGFNEFLNKTGLGNHPEMIRGFVKASKYVKQDGHVPGDKAKENNDARTFYPNSKMEP